MTLYLGMSAPANEWDQRVKEVGPGLTARRIFSDLGNYSSGLTLAKKAVAAGMWPIMSFKVPGNDWKGVAAGKYDKQLTALHGELSAISAGKNRVFATLHHEPAKDGTAQDWSAMLAHALPLVKGGENLIRVGPIANGWWWSSEKQGYTDQEIAAWLPTSVLKVSDIVAADTYQGGSFDKPGEDAGVKIKNMLAWATRAGVGRIGIPEFNAYSAQAITNSGTAALADSRVRFACLWNSQVKEAGAPDLVLKGDRLTAFKDILAKNAPAPTKAKAEAPDQDDTDQDDEDQDATAAAPEMDDIDDSEVDDQFDSPGYDVTDPGFVATKAEKK